MLGAAALTLGGNFRVGLEDNFYLPNGDMARSNGDLIAKARQMVEDVGRRPATVAEAREMFGTKKMAWPPQAAATRRRDDVADARSARRRPVLDLTRLLPGGFCTLLLADLGADVLKVEDTGGGDYIRWMPPYYGGEEEQRAGVASAYFLALNRNKRSLRLNLKDERGRDVLLRLVEDYDVLVESFRPGVMDRLGVGYDALRERNPRLIYCPISGYGQDGPLTARSGHDTNYLALNGLLGLTGRRGGPPIQSAGQIADLGGGGLMAAVGILAAVIERERSGEGQMVDISMTDGALSWLAMVAARYFAEQQVPQPRRARADRRHRLLLPLRGQGRRLGLAGRARAEVLAELVRRSRAPGPDREAVRAPGLRGGRRGRGACSGNARATSGRRSPASTTAAWSRSSTSTRRSTRSWCGRAEWSSSWTSPASAP